MKKFFAIASLALAAVSCLDTNTFYYNQNVLVAFDELLYDVNGKCVFESDDQEYLASSFYDGGLNFYCRLDKDKNYLGGFSIAQKKCCVNTEILSDKFMSRQKNIITLHCLFRLPVVDMRIFDKVHAQTNSTH